MYRYEFIKDIINKYWFQKVSENDQRDWIFSDEINKLSSEQFNSLIHLYLQCIDKSMSDEQIGKASKFLEKVRYFIYDGITINLDILSRFLFAITMAEYRIDDILLHPPDMRYNEFDEIAYAIGFDSDTVRKIYNNWHSNLRGQVLNSLK